MRYLSFIRHPLPPAARLINFFILILIWGLTQSYSFAGEGRKGIFYLNSGESVEGEIISVRNGSVIIHLNADSNKQNGAIVGSRLMLVYGEEIDSIVFRDGVQYGLFGQVIGTTAGVALGILVMTSDIPEENPDMWFLGKNVGGPIVAIGCVLGGSVGGKAIGDATSREDETLSGGKVIDWDKLREGARYPDVEPPSLAKLFPLP
jgi:hypothetical protein